MEPLSHTPLHATALHSPHPPSLSSLGPSGKLPIELLSEIFLLCIDEGMDERNTIHTPLTLSKICSRWRSAAIGKPQLWSRLFVQLIGASCKTNTALVDEWLARSGACPLTIYVFWEEPPFADTHVVLEKLMRHSERWKTMFFYLPYRAFASFDAIRGRLTMLTDLSLGTDDDVALLPSVARTSNLDMFEIAPRLRSLECVNFCPTIFKVPWAQLQDVPLLSGNIGDSIDVLHKAKRLSKMSFIFVEGGPPIPATILAPPVLPISPGIPSLYKHVYHNHLTCFTIMTPPWNEFVDLSGLFPHLKLPHLETLTICNLNSTFGDEFTQFLSGLHALRTLHLRKTALPDDQLVEGLKHLPALTNLIVLSSGGVGSPGRIHPLTNGGGGLEIEPTVTRYLLEALTRNFFSNDAMEGMLLPRLQKLELTVSSTAARELDAFIDMLQSRLRDDGEGLARLEHVLVRPCVDLNEEFMIRLVELKDMGLDIQVKC